MVRLLTVVVLFVIGSNAAIADSLWIAGSFGNEDGCKSIADSASRSENLLIVRSDSIERYEAHCGILTVQSSGGGWAILETICGGEGETWAETFLFQEVPDDRNKARLATAPSGEFADLARCD